MTKEQKILAIIIGNICIVIAQITFGLVANSYALIADALHNAGDVLAVIISFVAIILSAKPATFGRTFGYMRAEMMAAFVNSVFLVIAMLVVLYEAILKLFRTEAVEPLYMISVGLIALVANGISAYMLRGLGIEHSCGHDHSHHDHHEHSHSHSHEHTHRKGLDLSGAKVHLAQKGSMRFYKPSEPLCIHHDHHEHSHEHSSEHETLDGKDANIHSAYLHMLGDALISAGVVLAGVFIYFFEIYQIDAILTLAFSLYILKHSYPLLRKSFLSLMDANLAPIGKDELEAIILASPHVSGYHDLHIHSPSSKHNFISLHVFFDDEQMPLKAIEETTQLLRTKLEKAGFNHVLIQSDLAKNAQNHSCCEMLAD